MLAVFQEISAEEAAMQALFDESRCGLFDAPLIDGLGLFDAPLIDGLGLFDPSEPTQAKTRKRSRAKPRAKPA